MNVPFSFLLSPIIRLVDANFDYIIAYANKNFKMWAEKSRPIMNGFLLLLLYEIHISCRRTDAILRQCPYPAYNSQPPLLFPIWRYERSRTVCHKHSFSIIIVLSFVLIPVLLQGSFRVTIRVIFMAFVWFFLHFEVQIRIFKHIWNIRKPPKYRHKSGIRAVYRCVCVTN